MGAVRVVALPLQIPIRTTKIIFVKAGGLTKVIADVGRGAMNSTGQQKDRLMVFMVSASQQMSDKASALAVSGKASMRAGRDATARQVEIAWQSILDAILALKKGGRS